MAKTTSRRPRRAAGKARRSRESKQDRAAAAGKARPASGSGGKRAGCAAPARNPSGKPTKATKAKTNRAAARRKRAASRKPAAAPKPRPAARKAAAATLLGTPPRPRVVKPAKSAKLARSQRRASVAKRSGRRPTPASGRTPTPRARAAPRAKPSAPTGIKITGRMSPRYAEVLSPGALAFLAELHRKFERRRRDLMAARALEQRRYDAGALPDFMPETAAIRDGDWTVAAIPRDLRDRRVEITGPVDRKMIINALNSGANVYMADFEDANSPTWSNNIEGQLNLIDRWDGRLTFTDPESRKDYAIGPNPAVLIVRPRGWHLAEEHLQVDGQPISGALFDFGLAFFHTARKTIAAGSGPYFYIPKLESRLEARLWNDVFVFAQEKLGLPLGAIKATVLIETLPAAFQMHEILWELRTHVAGLNAGRWDYIFSFIKKLAKHTDCVLPDRSRVVMGEAFLHAYALLLIETCHRRRAFAMGGMAAQIPVKNDPEANERAFAKVRADKEREARDGHDGTWVAHPALVPVAKEAFDRLMPGPNQFDKRHPDAKADRTALLEVHRGAKTAAGFRENIRVGVQYIEAWLRGSGAVPIYNLMEDAATAEISRAQIWQWIKYGAVLEDGTRVTRDFFQRALGEEMERVRREVGPEAYAAGRFPDAIGLFRDLSLADAFVEFLTVPAYKLIV